MLWKSLTMPLTLSQREKKTGSECAMTAQTSLMTTQGGTMGQVTEKETGPHRSEQYSQSKYRPKLQENTPHSEL